ncbi:hypothetical protein JCM8547_005373 [Rhodosporidiobolus lusitaniae]
MGSTKANKLKQANSALAQATVKFDSLKAQRTALRRTLADRKEGLQGMLEEVGRVREKMAVEATEDNAALLVSLSSKISTLVPLLAQGEAEFEEAQQKAVAAKTKVKEMSWSVLFSWWMACKENVPDIALLAQTLRPLPVRPAGTEPRPFVTLPLPTPSAAPKPSKPRPSLAAPPSQPVEIHNASLSPLDRALLAASAAVEEYENDVGERRKAVEAAKKAGVDLEGEVRRLEREKASFEGKERRGKWSKHDGNALLDLSSAVSSSTSHVMYLLNKLEAAKTSTRTSKVKRREAEKKVQALRREERRKKEEKAVAAQKAARKEAEREEKARKKREQKKALW